MKRILSFLVVGLLLGGCATVSPEKISGVKSIAIISAIEPELVGLKIGFTVFNNGSWFVADNSFDVNAVVLESIRAGINREAKLVHGRDAGLCGQRNAEWLGDLIRMIESKETKDSTKQRLAELGKQWGVEAIVLIQSATVKDWIQKSALSVYGVGHFGCRLNAIHAVLQAKVYDCATGEFTTAALVRHSREVNAAKWHDSWAEYSPGEKRIVLRVTPIVLNEAVSHLLTRLGIAAKPMSELPVKRHFSWGEVPVSIMPEGNILEIPVWASNKQARDAVLFAFKERGWTVTSDTEDSIVAVHPKDDRQAVCTAKIADRKVTLTSECFEIKADGSRVPVEYIKRWHENIKELVFDSLLQAADSTEK